MIQSNSQIRHNLMQPASVAVLMFEELKRRNQDEQLRVPLELLEQALENLAKTIEALE
jgi:hypothetical protein